MPSSLTFPPWLLSVLLLPIFGNASPINRQVGISDNVFMTTQNGTDGLEQRVCSIDSVTYMDGETIPTSSPCEHCVCRPPGFACTITSCEYRAGCKAFRRSDQCCPEYQCECEKDGKIYQNGDKIMDNNNPCEVCYCQGGEIICAVIDCYWRNDCPPRYIDNRCCPMYDHCPPPAAQGPIRHRLPTLTSPMPISWLNLTQATSTAPPPPPPISEAVSTTEATTTTTTTPTTTVSTTTTTTTEEATSTSTTTLATTTTESVTSTTPTPISSSSVANEIVSNDEQESSPVSEAVGPVTEAITSSTEDQSEDDGTANTDNTSTVVPESDYHLTADDVPQTNNLVVPTTAQPEVHGAVVNNDNLHQDDQSTPIPLNDGLPAENVLIAEADISPTEPLPLGVSSTTPALTTQSDSSVAAHDNASSAGGSSIIAEHTEVVPFVVGTTQEPVFLDHTVIVNDAVITTAAPSNDIVLNDETFEFTHTATNSPVEFGVEVHDPTVPPVAFTETQHQDVTAMAVVEQEEDEIENANILADETSNDNGIGEGTTQSSPTIPLERDQGQEAEQESSTGHSYLVLNDEVVDDVSITTVAPSVVSHPQNDAVQEDEDSIAPEVRHDLFDDNTESSNLVDDVVLADTSGIVTTPSPYLTVAVINNDKVEDLSYVDNSASAGTTEREILQDAPLAAGKSPTVTVVPVTFVENLVVQEIFHDASMAPTAQPSAVADEAASAVTVQNDALPPSTSNHEDEVVSELVFNDDAVAATEQPLLVSQQQSDDAEVTGTANTERVAAVINDETATPAFSPVAADETVAVTQSSVNELDDVDGIVSDEPSVVNDEPVVTEKIINDDFAAIKQEIVQEDAPVPTQQPEQQQVYDDDDAGPVTTVTSLVHQDNDDEATSAVDDVPAVHNDVSSTAADTPAPSMAFKDNVAESVTMSAQIVEKSAPDADTEQISQDTTASPSVFVTEIHSAGNSPNNGIYDIILDDEESPSQPETLNQVRDQNYAVLAENNHAENQAGIDNLENVKDHVFSVSVETTVPPQPASILSVEVIEPVPTIEQVVNINAVNDLPEATTTKMAEVPQDETISPKSSHAISHPKFQVASLTQDKVVEDSTQRQFRDDIEDMLRHHINGASHEEAEVTSVAADAVPLDDEGQPPTTVRTVVAAAVNDDIDAPVIADDEPAVVTTVSPQAFQEAYRNKVQLVAETLAEQNVIIPSSDEEPSPGNKFRLEPSIFGGVSVENERNDVEVTTSRDASVVLINSVVPIEVLSDGTPVEVQVNHITLTSSNNDASAAVSSEYASTVVPIYDTPQTTVPSEPLASHDNAESDDFVTPTIPPSPEVYQDTVVETVTEKYVVNDDAPVTDSSTLIQNEEEHELADEAFILTTPVSVQAANDDSVDVFTAVEGSGSHHDHHEVVELEPALQDATEATSGGLARLDLDEETVPQSTIPPLNDEPATASSYSFRLDLSSVEDLVAEEASGSGPVQQDAPVMDDAAVVEVTSQSPKQEAIPEAPSASATEQDELVANDEPVTTTKPELEVVPDDQGLTADAAPTTLSSLFSRFRTDLEIDTETPLLLSSSSTVPAPVVAVDEAQNDFVVVSTGVPSGFAEETKENDEGFGVTHAPVVVPLVESTVNDEHTLVHQAEDIIPEDDAADATPANIPILSLITTDDNNKIVPFSSDDPVTQATNQGVSDFQHDQKVSEDLAVHDDSGITQPPQQQASMINQEINTETPVATIVAVNDEPTVIYDSDSEAPVTSVTVAISNDDTLTTRTVNDDVLVAVTEGVQQLVNHAVGDVEPQLSQEILRDESIVPVTQAVDDDVAVTERHQEIVNDETVVAVTDSGSEREHDEIAVTQAAVHRLHDEAVDEETPLAIHDETVSDSTSSPSSDSIKPLQDEKTEVPLLDSHVTAPTVAAPVIGVNDEPSVVSEPVKDDSIVFSDEPLPTVQPFDRLRSDLELGDSVEQQTTDPTSLNDLEATTSILSDDVSITTQIPAVLSPTANPSNISAQNIFAAVKVVKKEGIVLPETGLPKIQPFSPDLRRDEHNHHELRFDFPMSPEKDTSWLSRAVSQFRRLTGLGSSSSDTDKPSAVVNPRTNERASNRRFLLF